MDRVLGIDVSHHHPVRSWDDVWAAGARHFGAKATEGKTFVDSTFRAHRDGARQQPFGLVWYYHYGQPGDPAAQAGRLMDTVGPLRDNERLVLDLEGDTPADLVAAPGPAVQKWADGFLTTLLGGVCSNRRPLLYWSERIWNMIGSPTTWDIASEVDLILPRYGSGSTEPVVPQPWTSWVLWQFSETYACPGVQGPCDASWFNGSAADLTGYAKLAG